MYNRILVPLDGSKRSEIILPHVEELAQKFQAKVFLVTVHAQTVSTGVEGAFIESDTQEEQPKFKSDSAKAYLEEVSSRLSAKDIPSEYKIMDGLVGESILKMAEEVDADLVAMANHGKSGLSSFFHGSVALGLVNIIDRPFLLVRSSDS